MKQYNVFPKIFFYFFAFLDLKIITYSTLHENKAQVQFFTLKNLLIENAFVKLVNFNWHHHH
jgi:hypothetical protein